MVEGFLVIPDFLPPSHTFQGTLLLVCKTRASSSPGVGKLLQPVDEDPDDGAWSLAATEVRMLALVETFREMVPNNRDGFLNRSVAGACETLFEEGPCEGGLSEGFEPNMKDILRMTEDRGWVNERIVPTDDGEGIRTLRIRE